MCCQKDHLDGTATSVPWRFEIDIRLVDTGSLASIYMTLPDGSTTYPLDNLGNGHWEYESWPILYLTLTALQAVYPAGLYTFDFRDSSDSLIKSVQLDYSGIDEPGSPVDFTYPSDNGQTGIGTNPTLTWTVNSGVGDVLGGGLQDDYEGFYGLDGLDTWPVPMDTLSWQPGPLDPEQDYWLYVSVARVKDWAAGPGLPTKNVGGDEFEYGLHIGYMNKIGFTTAEPLLFPFQVGQQYEFHKWDSDDPVNEWTVLWEVESQVTIGSFDYFQIREWNYDNDGTFESFPYVRSTEDELYMYGPPDNLEWQKVDLGTSWSYYEPDASGMNYRYVEIVAIEPVTVPFGTFTTAYKHRKCQCEFPDGSGNRSPYMYEWIVPGVGFVKEVDEYKKVGESGPTTMELVSVTSVPEARLDIEQITIMTECEYLNGLPDGSTPWDFEIEVSVSDPGTLHHIDVLKPGSTSASLAMFENEPNSWSSDPPKHTSLAALRTDYPEGIYTFEFRDNGNALLKTIALNYSGLSAPTDNVDFTYPGEDGQTNISANPTFTWTVDPGAGDLLYPGVDDEVTGDGVYGGLPMPMTTQSWSPGVLSPEHEYHLDVTIRRVRDWVGPELPTTTIAGDTFVQNLTFDYINTISFTTAAASIDIHPADGDGDFVIGDFELLDYIDQWAAGHVGDFDLLDCIDLWAAGHYYWDENEEKCKPGYE